MEIISGRDRRRRWSVSEKLRIVDETQEPGACVRAVAARHDVYPNLLHYWRRQVREGRLRAVEAPGFVPVRLAEILRSEESAPLLVTARSSADMIEIRLPDGTTFRLGADVALAALRRMMTALRG